MKIGMYCFSLILLFFVGTAIGSYGTFKQSMPGQALKISIASKNFLRSILEKQELFVQDRIHAGKQDQSCVRLIQAMSQLYRTIVRNNQINTLERDAIMHSNDVLKKELAQQQGTFYVSQPESVWFEWFALVKLAVSQVHIYSRVNDLQWLQQQLTQFEQMIHSHNWDNAFLQKIIMRVFELCYEMIRLYDGTFVDDFDLLVLSNVIVVMMALRCG